MCFKRRILLFSLLALIPFSKVVFADGVNVNSSTESLTLESGVTMQKASWFKVTIPKKITLNGSPGAEHTVQYQVSVEGDLSGHDTIYVKPETSFTMKDNAGIKEIDGFVSQNDTSFTIAKIGTLNTSTTGTVSTPTVEAGKYGGNFNFEIYKEFIEEHVWGGWVQITPPTCETKGLDVDTCTICGGTRSRDVSPIGHSWKTQTDENGYWIQRCSNNTSHTKNNGLVNYKITYNLGGGTISGQKTFYTVTTDTFTLPVPTRSGYFFTGWTGSNGTTKQTSVTVNKGTTGDLTYTANWATTAVGYYNGEAYDLMIATYGGKQYTFVKVFSHDSRNSTYFSGASEASHTTGTKDAKKYSRLDIIENLKTSTEDKYVFRLCYPKGGNYDSAGNTKDYINVWRQKNRPQDESNENGDGSKFVEGYEKISIDLTGNYWGGLERSTTTATYIDGSTSHSNWFFAIGSYQQWGKGTPDITTNTTIPGGSTSGNEGYTSIFLVQLWLATDASKFTFN